MAAALLQALGATSAQIEQVKQAWLDMPAGASASTGVNFLTSGPITIRQYNALKVLAAAQKQSVADFCRNLFLQAVEQACADHLNAPGVGNVQGEIEAEAEKAYTNKIAELTK